MSAKPLSPRSRAPAARSLYTIYLVLGVFLLAVGGLLTWVESTASGLGFAAFGAFFALIGATGRRSGVGAALINTSLNLLAQGRLAEAERLLDEASKVVTKGPNLRAIRTQRAIIAFRRGQIDVALARIDEAIAAPEGRAVAGLDRVHIVNARGIRALLRASKGDADAAREDLAWVRASPHATLQALGRAAVAEVMLLARAGDRAALRAVLLRDRAVLLEGTSPRERAVVRAYQRMLAASPTTIYRQGAPRDVEAHGGGEPEIAEWIAAIAPDAAPFVRAQRAPAPDEKLAPLADARMTKAGALARKVSHVAIGAAGRKLFWKGASRRIAMLIVATGVTLAIFTVAAGGPVASGIPAGASATLLDEALAQIGRVGGAVAFGGIAVLVALGVRARRHLLVLKNAALGLATGDPAARAALVELAAQGAETISAQAHSLLAADAQRRGDLDAALAETERGLARLSRYATRALAADLLLPEIVAERAFLLALKGREEESSAEVASLPAAYPFLSRARFRVRLAQLVHAGDLAEASRLVAQRSLDLPLNPRDELLADAVRVAVSPDSCGAGEVARVKDELRTQPELRRWMEVVAPRVLRAAELASEGGDADAEREAEAAAEAESRAETLQKKRRKRRA